MWGLSAQGGRPGVLSHFQTWSGLKKVAMISIPVGTWDLGPVSQAREAALHCGRVGRGVREGAGERWEGVRGLCRAWPQACPGSLTVC